MMPLLAQFFAASLAIAAASASASTYQLDRDRTISSKKGTGRSTGSSKIILAQYEDLYLSGGAGVAAAPLLVIRSGGPGQHSTAAARLPLLPAITVNRLTFSYRYDTGYGSDKPQVSSNFSVRIAGQTAYSSPHYSDYRYGHNRSNYSLPVSVDVQGLDIVTPSSAISRLEFHFDNNDRNMQLLLPLELTVHCTGEVVNGSCMPPPPPKPFQVFMKGENVTGFNPTGDTRNYQCFRIPQLLALPSGRILAFAEGRADGCKPDVNRNRPIVVRGSSDEGKTWGPISIAGPATAHVGTNYPGAFLRDEKTVALRYELINGSVFETTSKDEGRTWSSPVEASQPPGGKVRCGSGWPKMIGSDVVMACAGGTARSSDGGRTWKLSTRTIKNMGVGEAMVAADGRTPNSLTMMIRGGHGWYSHAVATSDDGGDTWSNATILPIVGTTNEGSVGRDARAPPGKVYLGATYGRNGLYLGRGNMTVFALDTAAAEPKPTAVQNVWPDAAGYSDFAQVRRHGKPGPLLLLFEAGGTVYDYGIKIAPVKP